jgi:Domain of unknown function (DUF4410)
MFCRLKPLTFLVLSCLLPVLAAAPVPFNHPLAARSAGNGNPRQSPDFVATSVPVYISDFELFASAVTPLAKTSSPAPVNGAASLSGGKDSATAVFDEADSPTMQARRLLDFFSLSLVQSLKKSGYTVSRQASTGGGASAGILLRGVFAEPDARNRIRRAMLGGGAPGAKFFLYVGTFNLSRPDQPLYQVAPVQPADSRYGPVITPNAYIPLVKYELPKNPTDDDVRKICDEIARNLTVLVNANPMAFSH